MNQLREADRSMTATFCVVFPTLISVALLTMSWLGMSVGGDWGTPHALSGLGAIAATAALIMEGQIRSQLKLARYGTIVRGNIEEVHRTSSRYETESATYWFAPPGASAISGRCWVSETDAMVLQRGSEVEIVFDPENPKRNKLVDALWAVEWASEPAQSDG